MLVAITIGLAISALLIAGGGFAAYQARAASDAAPKGGEAGAWTGGIARAQDLSPTGWVHSLLNALPGIERLDRLRRRADVTTPLGALVGACLAPAGASVALAFVGALGMPAMLVIATVGSVATPAYLSWRAAARRAHFQRQLPDALDMMARSLRAGHAFLAGMKIVAEEFPAPIGAEFRSVVEEVAFGVSVTEALQRLTARVDSPALNFFVTSVLIQRESGGNLAEILNTISRMTRKRFELAAKVRAVSAEGRLSAVILFALPFALGGLLLIINPDYVLLLFRDPIGRAMVTVGGVLMLIGGVVTKRMVTVRE
jgi:tight adherence protein B